MKQAKKLLLMILPFFIISCHKKDITEADIKIDSIYQNAKSNSRTLQQSSLDFCERIKPYLHQPLSDISRAKIEYIHATHYRKNRQIDSSLLCFENGLSYLHKEDSLLFLFYINAARDAADLILDDKFRNYITKSETLAQKLKKPQYQASCIGARALYLMNEEKYEQAEPLLYRADSILATYQITEERDSYQYLLGVGYRRRSYFPEAYEHLTQSMILCKKNGNMHCLLNVYINICRIYRKEKRFEEALKWQQKYMELCQQVHSPIQQRKSYEGMGIIYAEMKKWDKAKTYFQKAVDYARSIHHSESLAVALTNFGNFYRLQGDYNNAINYYKEAYNYKLKDNAQNLSLIRCINSLGKAYMENNNSVMAKKYLNMALNLSDSLESVYWKSIINKSFFNLYKKEKNYPEAIKYITSYLTLKNEVDQRNASDKLEKLLVRYETQEKDHTIAIQKQEIKIKRNTIIGISMIMLLLISLSVLIIVNKKIRSRAIQSIYKQHLETQQRQNLINSLLKEKSAQPINSTENRLMATLLKLLDDDQIFRQKELTLDIMAKRLNTNITYVSQLINKEFECNFNTLINRYRIDYCKKKITESKDENVLMKQIGFEAGFSSQSTFYNAFKNEVGITPTQFRKAIIIEKGI
nr:AraC family transcriptional regulator [uncultured Carboxylicivirga sp.]